jgi:putative membrane protein
MNRIVRWGTALAVASLAACSNEPPPSPVAAVTPPPPPAVSPADQQFAAQAGASDQFEIQSSQLALQKSHNSRVRAFAQHMIDAHTQTTQQLTGIASGKGLTLAPALDQQQQQMLTDLQGLNNSRAFDRAYLHDQVVGHEAAVQVFQTEISGGQDDQMKAFAQQTLPAIEDHLKSAQRLGGRA